MIGVVLEGGGAKGSYQVGALLALKKLGIKIDGIVGTSIGAINAAFIAEHKYHLLKKLWYHANCKEFIGVDDELIKKIRTFKIDKEVLKNSWDILINVIKNKGLDKSNLRLVLTKNINEKIVRNSKVDYGLVTFNLSDGKPIQVFKDDIPRGKLIDYILASAHFPFFKLERASDNKFYFDGGIYDNCPINMLIDRGYKKIIAIRTHAIGITKKVKKGVNANIIYIDNEKNLGPMILFDKKIIRKNIKLGFYDTIRAFKNLDGHDYYIKNRDDKYYDKLISKSNIELVNKLKKEYGVSSNKDLVINCIEYILNKENVNRYKIYNPVRLLFRIKLLIKKRKIKEYMFIKSLKLRLY